MRRGGGSHGGNGTRAARECSLTDSQEESRVPGAILTFAFPMILFIIAAATLWVLYTMPRPVPRRGGVSRGRSVSATTVPAVDPQPSLHPGEDGPGTAAGSAEGGQ
jgi:hypothetical protein